jgi:glycosyltransferase involved in cell wall biosynthesis
MINIGIFRTVFPLQSECFIVEQASNLTKYHPVFINRTRSAVHNFDSVTISDNDHYGIKQKLYSITRSSKLFNDSDHIFSSLKLIHAHFGPDGIYALNISRRFHIPLFVTMHGFDVLSSDYALLLSKKPSNINYVLFKECLLKHTTKFIAVSKFIEKTLIEKKYPPNKIIQHYIGVDIDKFKPIPHKSPNRYVLCIGRHTEKKGIDTLLRAFSTIAAKHPDVNLIQVGDGVLRDHLASLAITLGIGDRVKFIGEVPHDSVVNLMQNAEIFALSSQTATGGDSEALGIVFNEASACGIPIVSTFHGGIPEAVLDGTTGLLCAERDFNTLAANLDVLLKDRSLAAQLGRVGREFVCDVFNINRQTLKLESMYDEILAE